MAYADALCVVIVGTGYVGLTTGVALAYLGHQVIGVDKDSRKLERLQAGASTIHESGLQGSFRFAFEVSSWAWPFTTRSNLNALWLERVIPRRLRCSAGFSAPFWSKRLIHLSFCRGRRVYAHVYDPKTSTV